MNYPFLEYDMKKVYVLTIQSLNSYINDINDTEDKDEFTELVECVEDFSIIKDFLIERFSAYDIEYNNSNNLKPQKQFRHALFPIPFIRVSYDVVTFKREDGNYVAYYKEDYIRTSLFE